MRLFKKRKKGQTYLESCSALLTKESPFAVSEAYKAMRTNLMYVKTEETCKRFVFTSAEIGEGKSTSCGNIAIAFAQMGKRVLLIDSDMRRPRLHRFFSKVLSPGLSEVLAGLTERAEIQHSGYENLNLLTAGRVPPNPAELLASKRMSFLLEGLCEDYDYIFIDMPPLNLVTDAAVLTRQVDGYVLVVRVGMAPVEHIKNAVLTLEQVNANIIGLLLNGVPHSGRHYYNKKYGRADYSLGRGSGSNGFHAIAVDLEETAKVTESPG